MKTDHVIKGVKRYLVPGIIISLFYFLKYRAKISHKAEVDLTRNLELGNDCVILSFTKVKAFDGPIKIGKRGGIATGCFFASGSGGIEIGDNFLCSPNVNIVSLNYSYEKKGVHLDDVEKTSKGIKIGDNVWIGAGCTITDGAVIGDNTIVVANSLVNRRYRDDVIIQGNPGKIILNR